MRSIRENTGNPYDLMVFDNASCQEVRSYLVEEAESGRIQYLTLSDKNIGKAGAWNFIFAAAPGETVAYADSDVYFYPGWLEAQMQVMETLPNVGMVTGMPLRNPEKFSTSTVRWAEEDQQARLERGALMPWEDFWRHVRSLGYTEAEARRIYAEGEDVCLYYQNRRYYVGAGHFQFVAPRKVLQEVLPIPSRRPMGEVRLLDIALNEKGYLRVCTPDWWVRHMGNSLSEQEEIPSGRTKKSPTKERGKSMRRLLMWIHQRTFEALYVQGKRGRHPYRRG
jgi:glycosyltransferase involved in cell wall biosynthesis